MGYESAPEGITRYYIEMDNIFKRLKELGKMDLPHFRSHYTPDGRCITEVVPEYLEQESLISRWKEMQAYERALDISYGKNSLLVALRLDLIEQSISGTKYAPKAAATIAISVYYNEPINNRRV